MTHTSSGKEQPLSQGPNKEWGKLRGACWPILCPIPLNMHPGLEAESQTRFTPAKERHSSIGCNEVPSCWSLWQKMWKRQEPTRCSWGGAYPVANWQLHAIKHSSVACQQNETLGRMRGGNPFSGLQSSKGCCHFGSGPTIKSFAQDSISQTNHTEGGLGQGVPCPAWISPVSRIPVSPHYGALLSRSQRGRGSWPLQRHIGAGLGAIVAALVALVKSDCLLR